MNDSADDPTPARISDLPSGSESRYRALFEAIEAGFCIVEVKFAASDERIDYRVIEANPAFYEQTGFPRAIFGLWLRDAAPELEEHWYTSYGRVAKTGEPARFEAHSAALDRWFEVYAFRTGAPQDRNVAILFQDISARHTAEAELRASEERFRRIFEESNDFIFVTDLQQRITACNPASIKAFGYRPEQVIGRSIAEFVSSAQFEQTSAMLAQKLREGGTTRHEVTVRAATGANRILQVHSRLTYGADGAPTGLHATARDVTEERAQDGILRASEARYRALVEALGTVVWTTRADGWCDDMPQWRALTGQSIEECTGFGWVNAIHPDDRATTDDAWRSAVAAARPVDVEYRIRNADGSFRWYNSRGTPVLDEHGTLREWVGVCIDIEARKSAEAAMRESEARFRNMADYAPIMVWVTDPDARCTYLSQSWYAFTGQSPATALGLGWLDAVHPEDQGWSGDTFLQANENKESFSLEYRLRRHDGEYQWAIDAAVPRFDTNGDFAGYVGSVIDIHDRKVAEEALQLADRQKDEFLAMLAHELRNPMAPIRNAAELLSRALPAESPLAPVSAMLRRQTQQLARLVDDLLDVSRITQGRIELKRQRIDLNSAISRALETVEPLFEERGHKLQIQTSALHLWVDADPERMVQSLSNILTNAAKYTEVGGQIHVLSHASGDTAVVAIADTGMGISQEMLPKVFDLFVQSDRALDRAQGGLGIGLSVVKRLVEMHGGSVTATSGGIGTGSTFEVRLPLQSGPIAAAGAVPLVEVPSRKVLIVDDNVDAAQSLSMLLSVEGHIVEYVTQPRVALDRARILRPDVILLDIGMPEMDGFEVAHRLKQIPELTHSLIVAVTGYGRSEDRAMSATAGFDAHLVKPVEYEAIANILLNATPGA